MEPGCINYELITLGETCMLQQRTITFHSGTVHFECAICLQCCLENRLLCVCAVGGHCWSESKYDFGVCCSNYDVRKKLILNNYSFDEMLKSPCLPNFCCVNLVAPSCDSLSKALEPNLPWLLYPFLHITETLVPMLQEEVHQIVGKH